MEFWRPFGKSLYTWHLEAIPYHNNSNFIILRLVTETKLYVNCQFKLNKFSKKVHLTAFSLSTDGIAVDWVNQKLYWTDADIDEIAVYDLSNGYRKRLFSTDNGITTTSPRAIVVDPMNR